MARRSRLGLMVFSLLALLAAACGDNGAQEAGAEPSGKITVYSGRSEELIGTLVAQFKAKTGIDVNVRYGSTSEMAALLAEEGSASPADVFWAQDAGALGAVQAKGFFATLPNELLQRVPAAFQSKGGNWVGVSGRVRVIAYNPDLVPASDLPASVDALTEPKWKGKVGWAPSNGSFQLFMTAFRRLKGDAAAKAWLEGMKANDAKTFPGNAPIVEAVAAGEISLGLVNHYYAFALLAEKPDAKVKDHFLPNGDVGGLVNVSGAGVLKTSKNAAAAQRFVEFLLDAEGQAYFVSETFEYPLAGTAQPDSRLPKLDALEPPTVDLSELSDLDGTLKMLQDVKLL
jgi:iron(III) transport system substrate-binding protein